MKPIATLLSVFVFLCVASQASADGECDKYATGYDKTYCMGKLFIESDKELNDAYKDLKSLLQGDVKKQLTLTQRDWMQYRDATCSQEKAINVECNYKLNRERAEYLRDRLRECKTGTCRNDMIAQKTWN
jgi:uncharacterized protein YecT (DUF1311 family)